MAALDLIEWDAPGPYRVAFSTRLGGVSEGPSLAQPRHPHRGRPRVRRREQEALCEAVGADPDGATMAWQRHGATVTRAEPRGVVTPGTVYEHCDGLWTDEPGRAMLLLTADCLPVALVRTRGGRRWRSSTSAGAACSPASSARVSAARRRAARRRHRPEHRPVLLRGRRRGRRAVPRGVRRRRRPRVGLDLWTCAERALRAAGCVHVERLDECTSCNGDGSSRTAATRAAPAGRE